MKIKIKAWYQKALIDHTVLSLELDLLGELWSVPVFEWNVLAAEGWNEFVFGGSKVSLACLKQYSRNYINSPSCRRKLREQGFSP